MDRPELRLTAVETADHARDVSVSGDLDLATAEQLSDMLVGLIDGGVLLIVPSRSART